MRSQSKKHAASRPVCLVGYTTGKRFSSLVTGRTHQPAQLQQAGQARVAPRAAVSWCLSCIKARAEYFFEPSLSPNQ